MGGVSSGRGEFVLQPVWGFAQKKGAFFHRPPGVAATRRLPTTGSSFFFFKGEKRGHEKQKRKKCFFCSVFARELRDGTLYFFVNFDV